MTLAMLEKIGRHFGAQTVLENCNLRIERGDRLGLVGENGSGKTTLLRILAGFDGPDEGTRRVTRGIRFAVAEQIPSFPAGKTVREAALSGLKEIEALAHQLDELHHGLAVNPNDSSLHRQLARAQEQFEALGGNTISHRAEEILCGLGFHVSDLDRPVDTLSGGEKSRVQLAGVLLAKADILLLDEPTNHLDLKGIDYLEGLLRSGEYTFVVVSHDRAFLDAVVVGILDIQDCGLTRWRGNYTEYARIRDLEIERQLKEWTRQQELIAKQEDFYRRYHCGQRSREAKGRMKRLRRLEVLRRPKTAKGSGPRMRWSANGPDAGYEVLRAEDLQVVVGDNRVLLDGVDVRVKTGDRIGIVGDNGAGKTTLLRALAGRVPIPKGRVERHSKATITWFDQEVQGLQPEHHIMQAMRTVTGAKPDEEELRSHLALFLFSGEELEKKVGDLSGGEARRLLLATLTWEPTGLLCLDEPTNHLDITAQESLEEALRAFGGTVVFVSHDRFFLERVATQVWFLEPPALLPYPGNWSEAKRLKASREVGKEIGGGEARKREKVDDKPRGSRKVNQFKLDRLEEEIFALEEELGEADASQTTPEVYQDPAKAKTVAARIVELKAELEVLYHQWEKASSPE